MSCFFLKEKATKKNFNSLADLEKLYELPPGSGRLEEIVNYQIVPMEEKHLTQVAALDRLCFPGDPWSEGLYRAALENPNAAVLLAEGEDGGVLGLAVLSAVLDEGNLDNIAVRPGCRRQGVADALLAAVTGLCRGRLAMLVLEVRASNAPALALYEKHGFAAVGRRKNYYTAPREDAILMTLELEHGTATVESR